MKKRIFTPRVEIVLIFVVLICWGIGAGYPVLKQKVAMRAKWHGQTLVKVVDAATGEALNPLIQTQAIGWPPGDPLSKFPEEEVKFSQRLGEVELSWTAIEPGVQFGISAEGHEQKTVELTKKSGPVITVPLKPLAKVPATGPAGK